MEAGRRPARSPAAVAVEALHRPARERRHAAADCRSTARSSRRRAAAPAGVDAAQIIYAGLKRKYADDSGAGPARSISSPARRRAGAHGARAAPASPSRCPASTAEPVFKEITRQGRAELVKQFAEDDWVWGDSTTGAAGECRDRLIGGDRSLRAGLHRRLGRAARRPAVRAVLDVAQTNDALRDPDGADVAAARPAQGRRRQHDARGRRPAAAAARRADRRDGVSRSTGSVAGMLKPTQEAARHVHGRRPAALRHGALPADPAADGRRSRQDAARRHPAADRARSQQQLDTLGPEVGGASPDADARRTRRSAC